MKMMRMMKNKIRDAETIMLKGLGEHRHDFENSQRHENPTSSINTFGHWHLPVKERHPK